MSGPLPRDLAAEARALLPDGDVLSSTRLGPDTYSRFRCRHCDDGARRFCGRCRNEEHRQALETLDDDYDARHRGVDENPWALSYSAGWP